MTHQHPDCPSESVADREACLGEQIRGLRLSRNLPQKLVAERAGIGEKAIRRLEAGLGSTLGTLIAVLEVLGRGDWLQTLAPRISIAPPEAPAPGKVRRRASAARSSPG